jgi:hypothetical protein
MMKIFNILVRAAIVIEIILLSIIVKTNIDINNNLNELKSEINFISTNVFYIKGGL